MDSKLVEALHNGVVTVTFTKVNGEKRVMPCTLMTSLIPATHMPKGAGKKLNESVMSVYCIDKKEWRSFRQDSIVEWKNGLDDADLNVSSVGNQ
jgi:hypothetical protein